MINIHQNGNCMECDKKCSAFKRLQLEELNYINQYRFHITYKKGEIIFKQNTPASNVISVSRGIAKCTMEDKNNKNLILNIVKGPALIAGPGIFVDNKYHYTLTALTDVYACIIDVLAFKKLIRENTDFADQYLSDLSLQSINHYNRTFCLTHKQMHGRVADALIHFSQHIFNANQFEIPLSRQELGEYTGLTKESVSRILTKFRDDELINLEGNNIEILNKEKIITISENG